MNAPNLIGQLREAELQGDAYGELALVGVTRSLLSLQEAEIQMMLQMVCGPDQEGISLRRLYRRKLIEQPSYRVGMQSQLGEPGNDGLGRFPYGLAHLVAPGGGRPHVAISEISGLVSIVEKGRAQQVAGYVERGQNACSSNAVRQERLASRDDEPAGKERGSQIVSIPDGPNDVRRIFEGFEMSVELKDRLRIATLEAGRMKHRCLVSFSVRQTLRVGSHLKVILQRPRVEAEV